MLLVQSIKTTSFFIFLLIFFSGDCSAWVIPGQRRLGGMPTRLNIIAPLDVFFFSSPYCEPDHVREK